MWKHGISPGQLMVTCSCSFPRQVDCMLSSLICCGWSPICPQRTGLCPQMDPPTIPKMATQAFLILWISSVIWLKVSGCSAICFVIFWTACIAVV